MPITTSQLPFTAVFCVMRNGPRVDLAHFFTVGIFDFHPIGSGQGRFAYSGQSVNKDRVSCHTIPQIASRSSRWSQNHTYLILEQPQSLGVLDHGLRRSKSDLGDACTCALTREALGYGSG